jgi:hypothetical protein
MDPLSITTAVAALVGACSKLTNLLGVINQSKSVDTSIKSLGIEINSLSQVLGNIGVSFGDSAIAAATLEPQTGHEAQHWRNVKQSMEDCDCTLKMLEPILKSVKQSESRIFSALRKQIKLEDKAGEIALLKQQIASYRQAMQLSLQLITVYTNPFFRSEYMQVIFIEDRHEARQIGVGDPSSDVVISKSTSDFSCNRKRNRTKP